MAINLIGRQTISILVHMRVSKDRLAAQAFHAGMRALGRHDPTRALPFMRAAVDGCPASMHTMLSRRLYWLSIVLMKLGRDGLAIKSLTSARKLSPRGLVRAVYDRKVNGYGMPKAICTEHDDYKAFFSIQVKRYLARVPGQRFADQAEIETVLNTIAAAWVKLERAGAFPDGSCTDKLEVFREMRIEFPPLRQHEEFMPGSETRVIQADFRTGTVVSAASRCPCGSGLPFSRCCGRVKMPFEI
jgi:hypothetical protein